MQVSGASACSKISHKMFDAERPNEITVMRKFAKNQSCPADHNSCKSCVQLIIIGQRSLPIDDSAYKYHCLQLEVRKCPPTTKTVYANLTLTAYHELNSTNEQFRQNFRRNTNFACILLHEFISISKFDMVLHLQIIFELNRV